MSHCTARGRNSERHEADAHGHRGNQRPGEKLQRRDPLGKVARQDGLAGWIGGVGNHRQATAGHRTGTVSTTGRTIAPGASAVTGNFFSQGDGMMLTLGDSGNGKFRIIAAYEVTAGGDAAYRGIATFLCTR